MALNTTTLTTVAECDLIISEVSREKTVNLNRKGSLELRLTQEVNNTDLMQRLAFIPIKMAGLQNMLAQNPPEEEVRRINIQIADTIKEQATMERQLERFGPHWRLLLQIEVEECDAIIAVKDAQLAELEAHKATLQAAGGGENPEGGAEAA
ncbi:MAG: hypothetical protein ACK5W1_10505 [Flavobacteriales bacterium]